MDKEYAKVPVSDITPYANNPRINDDAVDSVKKSIEQCGYISPIVIDENNEILVGHTRYKAIKELGWEDVDILQVSGLSDDQKRKYRLLDNKTGELADWDMEKLEEELDGLDFEDLDLDWGIEEDLRNIHYISERRSLNDRFVVPPFSVLDGRAGYWMDRKRAWRERIQDNAEARSNAKVLDCGFSNDDYFGIETLNPTSLLDPVLSEVVCRWFTPNPAGAKCCDPFAGDTVFGFVSGYLGAEFTGIELRQEQVDFNNQRVQEFGLKANYICDDGQNIAEHIEAESQDLLFSCPPYFDLEVYSDLDNDASNQDSYSDFIKILENAFTAGAGCLKENRFAAIMVGDIRNKKTGEYYDFPGDVKRIMREAGLLLYNELILVDPVGTAAIRAAHSMKSRKCVKTHQNLLIFYKGDPKEIPEEFPELEFDLEDEFASDDLQMEQLD